jgi:predicted nucleotidyltransferase
MDPPFAAAREFHTFLTAQGIPYAIIGGIAVQVWGEPRATRDVDLTIAVPPERADAAIDTLLGRFAPRIPDALVFARKNRVLLVAASNGVPVDVSLGLPGYEEDVIARSVLVEIAPGQAVRVCSPEDLVIHKAVAGRMQDRLDLEMLLLRRKGRLDLGYIRRWLTWFGDVLAMPDPVENFEAALRRASRPPRPILGP